MTIERANYYKVVKDVSLTLNIPKNTVEHVLRWTFGKVREGMHRNEFESFYIRGIGTFHVTEGRKQFYYKRARLEAEAAARQAEQGGGDTQRPLLSDIEGSGVPEPNSGGDGKQESNELQQLSVESGERMQQDSKG